MKKVKTKISKILMLAIVICLWGAGAVFADEKKQPPAKEKAGKIEAKSTLETDHPEIEAGLSCNDCHEIKLDANTSATQVWLTGAYLKWAAGEGVMTNDQVWNEILDIFKGKEMKRTFVMATACNNKPYTYTADFALDPKKKVLYAFHEKGTEKLFHIRNNPSVSMNWHREFDDDFANVVCFQVLGTAELFEGTAKEFEEGLNAYPYEYAAKARKVSIEQWREIVKKDMIMSRTTIERIRLTSGALARSDFRTSQEWRRK